MSQGCCSSTTPPTVSRCATIVSKDPEQAEESSTSTKQLLKTLCCDEYSATPPSSSRIQPLLLVTFGLPNPCAPPKQRIRQCGTCRAKKLMTTTTRLRTSFPTTENSKFRRINFRVTSERPALACSSKTRRLSSRVIRFCSTKPSISEEHSSSKQASPIWRSTNSRIIPLLLAGRCACSTQELAFPTKPLTSSLIGPFNSTRSSTIRQLLAVQKTSHSGVYSERRELSKRANAKSVWSTPTTLISTKIPNAKPAHPTLSATEAITLTSNPNIGVPAF